MTGDMASAVVFLAILRTKFVDCWAGSRYRTYMDEADRLRFEQGIGV